jgi:hypothetical protein
MRSAPLSQIALSRTAVAAPPPPGRGGMSAGRPPCADGSSVVVPPPPGAAADIFFDADAAELSARLRGVDWSVPDAPLPIDLPDELPASGPFFVISTRDPVDALMTAVIIVLASLASVAVGLGLGWLAVILN